MLLKIAKIFRSLLFAAIALCVLVPTLAYLVLSTDWAQGKLRDIGVTELSRLMGTRVEIDRVVLHPFYTLTLDGIRAADDNDSIALSAKRVDTRFEIWDFIIDGKVIIDYATITGLDLKLYRQAPDSALNIDRIVKRLSKKDPDKEPARFSLRLNDVVLEHCAFSYDVLSAPHTPGRFNPAHVALSDINLVAFAPTVANDDYHVWLRSLLAREASGLTLSNLSAEVELTTTSLHVADMIITMPRSRLAFNDIDLAFPDPASISRVATVTPVSLGIKDASHIYLPDLAPLVPVCEHFDYDINIAAEINATRERIDIVHLYLSDTNKLATVDLRGTVAGISHPESLTLDNIAFDLHTSQAVTDRILPLVGNTLSPKAREIAATMGNTTAKGTFDGSLSNGAIGSANADIDFSSGLGSGSLSATYSRMRGASRHDLSAAVSVDSLRLGTLLDNPDFNRLSATLSVDGAVDNGTFIGDVYTRIRSLDFKGHRYNDINVQADAGADRLSLTALVNDRYGSLSLNASALRADSTYTAVADLMVSDLCVDSLNLARVMPGYAISASVNLDAHGSALDHFASDMHIGNLSLRNPDGRTFVVKSIEAKADNICSDPYISIISDYVDARLDGSFHLKSLVPAFRNIYSRIIPALAGRPAMTDSIADIDNALNRFNYSILLKNSDEICDFFSLPLIIIDHAEIIGNLDQSTSTAMIKIEMPWIQNGNNLIENTSATINLDGANGNGVFYATSHIPTKKGDMDVMATITGKNGVLDTDIDWQIVRAIPINGRIKFITRLYRDNDRELCASVNIDNSRIVFGDEIWNISQSMLTYANNSLMVSTFNLSTLTQRINIHGMAGPDPADLLVVELDNIQLIDIFETLEIENAMIGGYASGTVTANGLMGKSPQIQSRDLRVRDIGYNRCTIGDAVIDLSLEDGGVFAFDADITGLDGKPSSLIGSITIPTEGLDLNIRADHVPVGFLKPFMVAFSSDIKGYASGSAHLYGTFHDIDLTGDVYAEDLSLKIDFTNTYYHAQDSIHIRPGRINLKNIVIRDDFGHTALLNGYVGHTYFHDATFDFNVSNARDFLCYDVNDKLSPDWYGRIFGTGWAHVDGGPGVVNIGVNMETAPNSVFTFVLSDQEIADNYSFITFRDVTPRAAADSIAPETLEPERVRKFKRGDNNEELESPTAYNMDIRMEINPEATVILVMDPVGGDRIKAYGSGNMRMTYSSVDNDLRLRGTYTLDKGSYNFTLQDIIIKDFTIKEDSSISFYGDPYSAQLNIWAYYQVNANLSDLDKSFQQDKELTRTNIPVRALMHVTGDMRQPDIDFDLEFPSLTSLDTYRKVKSIISTEDMMNRQIIYLLALNRFYTPEYMSATTKGSELFSVASSTIASQLSNMLGKLSENWSIAPNLRSDRGDFSDIEVDVTLSSSLLNNRLLFNGNFGYRDKSLNTNQFIGDFDIEYLLNQSGTWRFKAYNRYNDQNYYLRSALTTQGIGLSFRHDFDNLFGFLRKDRDKHTDIPADSVAAPADSILINESIIVTDTIPMPDPPQE